MMKAELEAGAWKVIAEARESGTSGIYMNSGEARDGLVEEILSEIKPEDVLWEAPQKVQQEYFINKLGCNVNLGNIAPTDVIPLETLRLGLRSDTFYNFLPEELKRKKK
jgi:phosphosulfolactate synthase